VAKRRASPVTGQQIFAAHGNELCRSDSEGSNRQTFSRRAHDDHGRCAILTQAIEAVRHVITAALARVLYHTVVLQQSEFHSASGASDWEADAAAL